MDIMSPQFTRMVYAGAKWIADHPHSSLGTTKETEDFGSFCDAIAAASENGRVPSGLGLVIIHSQALHKVGRRQYEMARMQLAASRRRSVPLRHADGEESMRLYDTEQGNCGEITLKGE